MKTATAMLLFAVSLALFLAPHFSSTVQLPAGECSTFVGPRRPAENFLCGGKININSATVEELEAIPGIGRVLAHRIIAYRMQHGPFREILDIISVSGIGEKTLEKLKPYLIVKAPVF